MAQQVLNDGESGLIFRTKLNDNYSELYAAGGLVEANTTVTASPTGAGADYTLPAAIAAARAVSRQNSQYTYTISCLAGTYTILDTEVSLYSLGSKVIIQSDSGLNTDVIIRVSDTSFEIPVVDIGVWEIMRCNEVHLQNLKIVGSIYSSFTPYLNILDSNITERVDLYRSFLYATSLQTRALWAAAGAEVLCDGLDVDGTDSIDTYLTNRSPIWLNSAKMHLSGTVVFDNVPTDPANESLARLYQASDLTFLDNFIVGATMGHATQPCFFLENVSRVHCTGDGDGGLYGSLSNLSVADGSNQEEMCSILITGTYT